MPSLFTINTKKGNKVEVYNGAPPLHPSKIQIIRERLNLKLGIINERSLPDPSYNCHGFTFASRLGNVGTDQRGEKLIILPSEADLDWDSSAAQKELHFLLDDNGFQLKAAVPNIKTEFFNISNNIRKGDIALYKNSQGDINHSCVVYEVRQIQNSDKICIKVLSKLGDRGEYFHSLEEEFLYEQYGSYIEIWSNSI